MSFPAMGSSSPASSSDRCLHRCSSSALPRVGRHRARDQMGRIIVHRSWGVPPAPLARSSGSTGRCDVNFSTRWRRASPDRPSGATHRVSGTCWCTADMGRLELYRAYGGAVVGSPGVRFVFDEDVVKKIAVAKVAASGWTLLVAGEIGVHSRSPDEVSPNSERFDSPTEQYAMGWDGVVGLRLSLAWRVLDPSRHRRLVKIAVPLAELLIGLPQVQVPLGAGRLVALSRDRHLRREPI